MTISKHKKHKTHYQNWLVPACVILVFMIGAGFLIRIVMSDQGPRRKDQVTSISLLKPPPEVKEKPPEPEIPKEAPKESIVSPVEAPQDQPQDQPPDNAPQGSDLGVEGEGGAGSDAFGLRGGIKGGHSIILGGGGGGLSRLSLLTKYSGYIHKIQEEIKKQVKKKLDKDGGYPKGKFETKVKIVLDAKGAIVKFQIVGNSGNSKVDDAVQATLGGIRISEPPPEGMPSGMTLKIMSQG